MPYKCPEQTWVGKGVAVQRGSIGAAGMNWKELYDRASFRSLRDLCVVGARKKLNPSDLPPLPREESSAELSRIAFDGWDRTGSLSSALWTVTKRPILYAAPLEFLNICFQLALPLVLRSLLVWISDPSTSTWLIGAGYVTLLFLLRLLSTSILTPQCYALCTRAGIRAERAAMLLVSRKLLRLRGGTRGTGEIVSALAMDATRFGPDLVCHTHLIWSAPLLIALAAVLMFHFLGLAAVGALVVMVLASASMGIVVRKERVLYDIVYKRSDSRMRALTGLLDILRQAKMAAWEDVLARDVRGQRRRQMEAIRKACAVEVVAYTLWDVAPPLTAIAAFGAAGIIPGSPPLTADVIFPVLALIETIKVPLSLMPIISAYGMQAMVCLSRLQRFLEEAECQGRLQMSALPTTETAGQMLGGVLGWHNPKRSEDGGNGNTDTEEEPLALGTRQNGYGAIVVDQTNERASHKVDAPEFSPVLHNVIVSFEKGALIIVRGPVAAGKSKYLFAYSICNNFE